MTKKKEKKDLLQGRKDVEKSPIWVTAPRCGHSHQWAGQG